MILLYENRMQCNATRSRLAVVLPTCELWLRLRVSVLKVWVAILARHQS